MSDQRWTGWRLVAVHEDGETDITTVDFGEPREIRVIGDTNDGTVEADADGMFLMADVQMRGTSDGPTSLRITGPASGDTIEVYPHPDEEGATVYDWRRRSANHVDIRSTSGGQGYTERNDAVEAAAELNPGCEIVYVDE